MCVTFRPAWPRLPGYIPSRYVASAPSALRFCDLEYCPCICGCTAAARFRGLACSPRQATEGIGPSAGRRLARRFDFNKSYLNRGAAAGKVRREAALCTAGAWLGAHGAALSHRPPACPKAPRIYHPYRERGCPEKEGGHFGAVRTRHAGMAGHNSDTQASCTGPGLII